MMQQAGYYGMPRPIARRQTEKYLRKMGLWEKRANGGPHAIGWHEAAIDDCPSAGA